MTNYFFKITRNFSQNWVPRTITAASRRRPGTITKRNITQKTIPRASTLMQPAVSWNSATTIGEYYIRKLMNATFEAVPKFIYIRFYRNFIDSQSDCCSSLSATNNLDSFSPPRMDSLQKRDIKVTHITQEAITNCVDHARRQRTLDIQYERRRKNLEVRRKSCQGELL